VLIPFESPVLVRYLWVSWTQSGRNPASFAGRTVCRSRHIAQGRTTLKTIPAVGTSVRWLVIWRVASVQIRRRRRRKLTSCGCNANLCVNPRGRKTSFIWVASPLLPWQLCSGYAHGRIWAIVGLSGKAMYPHPDPKVQNLRLSGDAGCVLFPARIANLLMEELAHLVEQRC
jgi:hypothetical protein